MKKTNHSMPDLDIHSLQMRLPIMLSNGCIVPYSTDAANKIIQLTSVVKNIRQRS